MPQRTNIKENLAKILTGKLGAEGDGNTEFPTADAINYQLYTRILGSTEGFDLPYFKYLADKMAELMLSYERKSRGEAVQSLTVQLPEIMQTGMMPRFGKQEVVVDVNE